MFIFVSSFTGVFGLNSKAFSSHMLWKFSSWAFLNFSASSPSWVQCRKRCMWAFHLSRLKKLSPFPSRRSKRKLNVLMIFTPIYFGCVQITDSFIRRPIHILFKLVRRSFRYARRLPFASLSHCSQLYCSSSSSRRDSPRTRFAHLQSVVGVKRASWRLSVQREEWKTVRFRWQLWRVEIATRSTSQSTQAWLFGL